jgi:hypothetical protein
MKTILFRTSLVGMLAASAFYAQSLNSLDGNPPSNTGAGRQMPARYTVTDLGPVGGPPGQPFVIKDNGLISGAAAVTNTTWHAVLWYQGRKTDIGKPGLGGPSSAAFGVNQRGQAVGGAETPDSDPNGEDFCGFGSRRVCQPFIWQNGVMAPLPPLKNQDRWRGGQKWSRERHQQPRAGCRHGREYEARLHLPGLESRIRPISTIPVPARHLGEWQGTGTAHGFRRS